MVRAYAGRHTPAREAARLEARRQPGALPSVLAVAYRCREANNREVSASDDNCGGIGDRFIGSVSVLLLALLSDTGFAIDWPLAAGALQPPLPPPNDDGRSGGGWGNGGGIDWSMGAFRHLQPSDVRDVDMINELSIFYAFQPDTLTTFLAPASPALISFRTNRGSINLLWSDRLPGGAAMKQRIAAEWGLAADTTFGCMLHALFRPSEHVVARFAPLVTDMLSGAFVFIGIHIRVGDQMMKQGAGAESFGAWFDAAAELERKVSSAAAAAGKTVRWLLVSDNAALRADALTRYRGKLVVPDVTPVHVSKRDVQKIYGSENEGSVAEGTSPSTATLEGVGEWWLLSQCDYFVINVVSAFGRTAAAYSLGGAVIVVPGSSGEPQTLASLWDSIEAQTRRRARARRARR